MVQDDQYPNRSVDKWSIIFTPFWYHIIIIKHFINNINIKDNNINIKDIKLTYSHTLV